MTRLRKYILAIATVFTLGLAAAESANAVPVAFTNRALFNATAGSTSAIDFDSAAANNGYTGSLTFAGVQFGYVGPSSPCSACGVGVVNGANFGTSSNGLYTNAPSLGPNIDTLAITMPTGTRSFGFDFKGSNGTQIPNLSAGSYTVTVNFADNTSQTFAIANPTFNTFGFFGVTSDVDISSIMIAMVAGGQPLLDNVAFGPASVAEVPEPATMILFGTGLAGIASLARKRRLSATSSESEDESPAA